MRLYSYSRTYTTKIYKRKRFFCRFEPSSWETFLLFYTFLNGIFSALKPRKKYIPRLQTLFYTSPTNNKMYFYIYMTKGRLRLFTGGYFRLVLVRFESFPFFLPSVAAGAVWCCWGKNSQRMVKSVSRVLSVWKLAWDEFYRMWMDLFFFFLFRRRVSED